VTVGGTYEEATVVGIDETIGRVAVGAADGDGMD